MRLAYCHVFSPMLGWGGWWVHWIIAESADAAFGFLWGSGLTRFWGLPHMLPPRMPQTMCNAWLASMSLFLIFVIFWGCPCRTRNIYPDCNLMMMLNPRPGIYIQIFLVNLSSKLFWHAHPILSRPLFATDKDGGRGRAGRKKVVNPFAKIQVAAAKRAEIAKRADTAKGKKDKKNKKKDPAQDTSPPYSWSILLYCEICSYVVMDFDIVPFAQHRVSC